jgi:hypothetical protein
MMAQIQAAAAVVASQTQLLNVATPAADADDDIDENSGEESAHLTSHGSKQRKQSQKISTSLSYDKLIHMHNFLESTSGGLSQDQMKSIHQNPLQFIRVDKDTELVDLL